MARSFSEIIKDNPLLTRQEFCIECAVGGKQLHYQTLVKDIREGDVISRKDNKIDIRNEKNQKYFSERLKFLENQGKQLGRNLDLEKKELEVAKLREEYNLKKLQRAKMEAELIPTELVYTALASHFKFVRQQFYYAVDQVVNDVVRKHGGSKEDMSNAKTKIIRICNSLVEKAHAQSADEIKRIISDFSALYGK